MASPNPPKPSAAPKAKSRRVKVRAMRTGYYLEERKRAGAVFVYELSEKEEQRTREKQRTAGDPETGLPSWVEEVSARVPEDKGPTGQQEINQVIAEARDQRAASSTDADVL